MANSGSASGSGLNTLQLVVTFPEDGADTPRVAMFVDGRELLGRGSRTRWTGFDPSEILASQDILLPGDRPRRVAIYRCSCGEPGCGSLAPVIKRDGNNRVRWTDFRDFTGVFDGPVTLSDPDDDDPFSEGTPIAIADVVFDRHQYEAEIARATADMS